MRIGDIDQLGEGIVSHFPDADYQGIVTDSLVGAGRENHIANHQYFIDEERRQNFAIN